MQCNWLDNRKDRSENTVSKHKAADISEFRKRRAARVARSEKILPGLGALLADKPGKAFRRLLLLSLGLTLLVSGGAFIGSFIPGSPDLTAAVRGLGGLLLALIYWRAWRPIAAGV